jgi:adenylate kinase family enzyme
MTSGSVEPWVAILCGPTGSGKSTIAARVSRALECVIASTNAQRYAIFAGSYPDKALWARSRDLVYALVDDVVEKHFVVAFP